MEYSVVLPGPKDSSCGHLDRVLYPEWFCRGELEYIVDELGNYGTRCKKCNEIRMFCDNEPEFCPNCKVDFMGWAIPQEDWHCFGARFGSRKFLVYDIDKDETVAYRCPDCQHEWDRE